jgi:hypothetical protein
LLSFSLFQRERKVLYTELSCSSPRHGQFFRPLNLIVVSVPIVRHHDVTPPSSSATVPAPLRPHGLTIDELRVVYARYPAGSADRCRPAAAIKGKPLPEPPQLGNTNALVLPPASLGHPATRASLPSVPFLAEQAVAPSSSTSSSRSSKVDRKQDSSQADTP